MDAVEIMREYARMCLTMNGLDCENCELSSGKNGTNEVCNVFMQENPEKAVEIVEKWMAEHAKKTRLDEFLKMFPNAQLRPDGMLNFDLKPCDIDLEYMDKMCDQYTDCQDCCNDYWLAEIDDEK